MDMAWRPSKVGKIIIQHGFRGVWGSDTKKFRWVIDGRPSDRPYSVPQFRDPMLGTSWESRTFKRVVLPLQQAGDARSGEQPALHRSEHFSHHGQREPSLLTAHELQNKAQAEKQAHRADRAVWVNIHNDDHLADCESHAALRALQLGLLSPPGETDQANVET